MKKNQSTDKEKNLKSNPCAGSARNVIALHKKSRQSYGYNGFEAVPALTARRLQGLILHHLQEVLDSSDP
jgi:hypothetical protein